MRCITSATLLATALFVAGCTNQQSNSNVSNAINDVMSRENRFPDYPRPDTAYLTFSKAHGFQVNYLAPGGKAWLWIPGNQRGVAEEYKVDVIGGQDAICWRHPSDNFNPVTRTRGGPFACQSLALSQRAVIASLPGDSFSLKTGRVPQMLDRCTAPSLFSFDRNDFSC